MTTFVSNLHLMISQLRPAHVRRGSTVLSPYSSLPRAINSSLPLALKVLLEGIDDDKTCMPQRVFFLLPLRTPWALSLLRTLLCVLSSSLSSTKRAFFTLSSFSARAQAKDFSLARPPDTINLPRDACELLDAFEEAIESAGEEV